MSTTARTRHRLKSIMGIVGISLVLVFLSILLVLYPDFSVLLNRFWVSASSKIEAIPSLSKAVLNSQTVTSYSHGNFTNIIFLHHSTGRNLIEQGHVREQFTKAGYTFWDHGYNFQGLTDPYGDQTGYSYNIPFDNTNPDGLARIFAQPSYEVPLNTFSSLLQHEVIAFKSCFPVSHITSSEQLDEYKFYYLNLRNVMDRHQEKMFIVVTPPPLNPTATNAEAAARARIFAEWLKSEEYLDGHYNVFTFDLFGYLAEDDTTSPDYNMLRLEYREDSDSHPNRLANENIGPLFVDFIVKATQTYRSIDTPSTQ